MYPTRAERELYRSTAALARVRDMLTYGNVKAFAVDVLPERRAAVAHRYSRIRIWVNRKRLG